MKLKQSCSYFYLLSLFHVGSVLIGMTVTSRIILVSETSLNPSFHITGGIFFIPIVFFIQDIVTETYGYHNAKKMLHTTLVVFALYVLGLYVLALLPCKYNDQACENFSIVAKTLPRHTISFLLALAAGGTANNYILTKLKLVFNSKFLAFRFISSTAIGEAIFQLIAVLISWYGKYPIIDILPLAIASYVYKILFETLATPINLYVCHHLKIMQNKEINHAF